MTVVIEPVATRAQFVVGTTPGDTFVIPFPFDAAGDVVVTVDGVVQSWTLTGGVEDGGVWTGAYARLPAPVSNATVVVARRSKLSQEAVFPAEGSFRTAVLNRELSRLWMALQDAEARVLSDIVTRPAAEGADPPLALPARALRANRVLAFDAGGAPIAVPLADQSGTTVTVAGTVAARTLAQAGRDVLNVRQQGAVGDGAADDRPAIQATIDACHPDYGGVVYLPGGRYRLTGKLNVTRPNVTIKGDGMGTTFLQVNAHTFDIIDVLSVGQVEVRDLQLQCFSNVSTQFWAVRANAAYRVRLHNVLGIGMHSFCWAGGAEFRARDCFVYNIRPGLGVGYLFDGHDEVREVHGGYLQNPAGQDAAAGVLITRGSGITLTDLQLVKMGTGVLLQPPVGHNVVSTKLRGVWCDTSSGNGIQLDGTAGAIHRVAVADGWMSSCLRGVYAGGVVTGIGITDCEVFDNQSNGIEVVAGANIQGSLVDGCRIAGNGGSGIGIGANVSNFSLTGNVVGPCADFGPNGHGIFIVSGTGDGYLVAGNRLRGNTGSALVDGGTGGSKVVANNLV